MARRISMGEEAVLDKTQEQIENEMAAKAPAGIPIVTGGLAPGESSGGPKRMVVVVDLIQPTSRELLQVSLAWNGGCLEQRIPLNTPTLVCEALIRHIEGNTLENNSREITPDSAMYGNPKAAESKNPGFTYTETQDGRAFLNRTTTRYLVRPANDSELRGRV